MMVKDKKHEIDLLYGETILILKALSDVAHFEVIYSVPLNYEQQVPILFNIANRNSSKVTNYEIEDDINPPNKIIRFKIESIKKDEEINIHFNYYVLIKNNEYFDLPDVIEIPHESNLPESVRKWLLPTKAVQSDNLLLKIKAKILNRFNNNILKLSEKIVAMICFHRLFLYIFRMIVERFNILANIFFCKKYYTGLNDAISCYIFGGLCAAQTHLGTALLRANGVPTRILITTPMFYGDREYGKKRWLDAQHYLFECYCPDYGWVRGMTGKFPYDTKCSIAIRIIDPKEENIAGNGLSEYGGCEPWFWINNKNIVLVSSRELSRSIVPRNSGEVYIRGWTEKEIMTTEKKSDESIIITKKVWDLFTKIFGVELEKQKKQYYEKALNLHKKAIDFLRKSDVENYIKLLNQAYLLYKKIVTES